MTSDERIDSALERIHKAAKVLAAYNPLELKDELLIAKYDLAIEEMYSAIERLLEAEEELELLD